MDMPDGKGIKGVFTNKIGPFPAYVWSGGAVAIYVVYRYMKEARSPATPTTEVVDPNSEFPSASDGSDYMGNLGNANSNYSASTAATTQPDQAIPDNQSWARQAQNWLIGQGMNPIDVVNTIAAYLSGSETTLNSTQTALLNQALAKFGAPPDGVLQTPPTTPVPTPVVTTPNTRPVTRPLPTSIIRTVKVNSATATYNGQHYPVGTLLQYDQNGKLIKVSTPHQQATNASLVRSGNTGFNGSGTGQPRR